MSFRVSSVAGAENLAVRVLTNPSDTNAMRVDYFQLLRKWRVDLIRYGLRMTYDLVIPNHGIHLIGRVLEIQAIDEMLTTAAYSFDLKLSDVIRETWPGLSLQYGVVLDQPRPDCIKSFEAHKEFDIKDQGKWFVDAFDFEVDPDYTVDKATFSFTIVGDLPHPKGFNVDGVDITLTGTAEVDSLKGLSGKLAVQYGYYGYWQFTVKLIVQMKITVTAYTAWQVKAWNALRNADQAAYDKRIEKAKERKAYLQAEMARFDALTLRKMEREEIMRWVLRWLFGPTFNLMPAN